MSLPVEIQARMDDIRAEVEAAGAELVDLLFYKSHQRSILTFLVDKAGGITLDECAVLNQKLGAFFDRVGEQEGEGIFRGQYLLEVSSPGLDRPLKTPKDFERIVGQAVRVTSPRGGPYVGKLGAVTESGIELEEKGGQRRTIAFADIAKATRDIGFKH